MTGQFRMVNQSSVMRRLEKRYYLILPKLQFKDIALVSLSLDVIYLEGECLEDLELLNI